MGYYALSIKAYNRPYTNFKKGIKTDSVILAAYMLVLEMDVYYGHDKMVRKLINLNRLDNASKCAKDKKDIHLKFLKMTEKLNRQDQCLTTHNRLVKYYAYDYDLLLDRAKYPMLKKTLMGLFGI